MSMLAEPKRRQRWSLNPRGNNWAKDTNKYGQRLMEKMGWSQGKGLGANEDGIKEHVRLAYKNDSKGVGFKDSTEWSAQQDNFNTLLQTLNDTTPEKAASQIKSLEEKSQSSRFRLHYKKFTRSKDLSRLSEKDLANIFGKKNLKRAEKDEETHGDDVESKDEHTYGVNTVKGGSMVDYFRNKKLGSIVGRARKTSSSSEGGEVAHGFGFKPQTEAAASFLSYLDEAEGANRKRRTQDDVDGTPAKKHRKSENAEASFKKSPDTQEASEELEESDTSSMETGRSKSKSKSSGEPHESTETNTEAPQRSKKSKDKRRNQPEGLINPAFDPMSRASNIEMKTHQVLEPIFENEDSREPQTEPETPPGRRKKQNGHENAAFEDNSENSSDPPQSKKKKKKKKKNEPVEGVQNPSFDEACPDASTNGGDDYEVQPKKKKKNKQVTGIENPGFNPEARPDAGTNGDVHELQPKKMKKKNKQVEGIENPSFNPAASPDASTNGDTYEVQPKKKKKSKKTENGIDNPGLQLNDTVTEDPSDCNIMLNVTDEPLPAPKPKAAPVTRKKSVRFSNVCERHTYAPKELAERNELYDFNTKVITDGLKDLTKKKNLKIDFDFKSIDRIDFCDDGMSTKSGLDNRAFDAKANSIAESVEYFTKSMEKAQAEAENGINESKDKDIAKYQREELMIGEMTAIDGENEKLDSGVMLRYKYAQFSRHIPAWVKMNDAHTTIAKKSYKHLIRGDIHVGFKDTNLHKINGYGVFGKKSV